MLQLGRGGVLFVLARPLVLPSTKARPPWLLWYTETTAVVARACVLSRDPRAINTR